MKKLLICVMLLTGCANETIKEVVKKEPIAVSETEQDIINTIIDDENEHRLKTGLSPLVPGLVCTLHNLQATMPSLIPSSPPSAVSTFVYEGSFNNPNESASNGINILPQALRSVYQQWYLIRCQGQFVATSSDYYQFNLTSDDGSNLYLDGVLLLNNDGNHSMQLKTNSKYLKKGIHAFRLDYMQGPAGNQGLILTDKSGVISGYYFYR